MGEVPNVIEATGKVLYLVTKLALVPFFFICYLSIKLGNDVLTPFKTALSLPFVIIAIS